MLEQDRPIDAADARERRPSFDFNQTTAGGGEGMQHMRRGKTRRAAAKPRPTAALWRAETLETRRLMATITWNSDADGFFDDASKWTGGVAPGANDVAVVDRPNANPVVTLRDTRTVGALIVRDGLAQTAGRLELKGDSSISGVFNWSTGAIQIDGAAALTLSGVTTLDSASVHDLAGTLNNTGTITHAGNGPLRFITATLNNSGVYDFRSDADIQSFNGPNHFNNAPGAVLRKSNGTGDNAVSANYNAAGATSTIDVRLGSISLSRGQSLGGTFLVAPNAALDLTSGTSDENVLAGTYAASGGGTVQLSGGRLKIGQAGATFNFPGTMFKWLGGTINADVGALSNANVMSLRGDSVHDLVGTINNNGTIHHDGDGPLRFITATINNAAGAVYSFNSSADIQSFNGPNNFNNAAGGVLRKTLGGDDLVDVSYNGAAASTIDVQTGSITLRRGQSAGGAFNVSVGAVLDLTGGADGQNVLAGNYVGTGGGTVQIASGRLSVDPVGATFNFPGGQFQWIGGTIDARAGTLTNAGVMTLVESGVHDLYGSLDNAGTIRHVGSGPLRFINGVTFNNRNTYEFRSDADIQNFNGPNNFNNLPRALVRKAAGTGDSHIDALFNNSGAAGALPAGRVNVQAGSISVSRGRSTGGTIDVAQDAVFDLTTGDAENVLAGTYTGSGPGVVQLNGGRLNIDDAGATFNFPTGLFHWFAGTIATGAAGLTNAGVVHLSRNNVHDLVGLWINNGLAIHDGVGPLRFINARLINTGTYELRSDADLQHFNELDEFHNAGALLKTDGGDSLIDVPLNNGAGKLIDVRAGSITWRRGFSHGGTFNVAPGAVLDLTGGSNRENVFTGNYGGSGGGTVQLAGGALRIAPQGASFGFPAGMFNWAAGTIVTLLGAAPLTNVGAMSIVGDNVHDLDGVLSNAGLITHLGNGPLRFFDATLDNTGVYDLKSDADFQNFGLNAFNNAPGATLLKSAGAGDSRVDASFYNASSASIVEVRSGSISIARGASAGGTFNAAAGATIDLTGNTSQENVLTGFYTGSGGGTVQLGGGVLRIGSAGAKFQFPAGLFKWFGGSMRAAGTLVNSGGIAILGDSVHDLAGSVQNDGAITHGGNGPLRFFDAAITDAGTYEFQSGADFQSFGSDSFIIAPGAVLRKTAGDDNRIDVGLDNRGTLETFGSISVFGAVSQAFGSTLAGGIWRVLNGGSLDFSRGPGITVNAADVTLQGSGVFNKLSRLSSNFGKFSLLDGATFFTAGNLFNSGAITLGQGALLTVNRPANQDPTIPTFVQASAGTLAFQVAGTSTVGQFGRLVSVGPATLDGAVTVLAASGFRSAAGDVYPLVTFPASTGSFASVGGLGSPPFVLFTSAITPTAFIITGTGNAAPPSPRVTDVFVSGTQWSTAFRQSLLVNGVGEQATGFRVGSGAAAFDALPWTTINQISVRFNLPVNVKVSDLSLAGLVTANYPAVGMSFNSATNTATWTLSQPIGTDRVLIQLDGDAGGVTGLSGGRLDGEYAGALPSGDGREGGDFRYQINVLPGDVTRNGEVNAADLGQVRRRLPGSPAPLAYSPLADFNTDGVVNAADEAFVLSRQVTQLPAGRAGFKPGRVSSLRASQLLSSMLDSTR